MSVYRPIAAVLDGYFVVTLLHMDRHVDAAQSVAAAAAAAPTAAAPPPPSTATAVQPYSPSAPVHLSSEMRQEVLRRTRQGHTASAVRTAMLADSGELHLFMDPPFYNRGGVPTRRQIESLKKNDTRLSRVARNPDNPLDVRTGTDAECLRMIALALKKGVSGVACRVVYYQEADLSVTDLENPRGTFGTSVTLSEKHLLTHPVYTAADERCCCGDCHIYVSYVQFPYLHNC